MSEHETLSFREFQALLINNGFSCGPKGADGSYGPGTAAAFKEWGTGGASLFFGYAVPPPIEPSVPEQIVPQDWMPVCDMTRVILHWTAGANVASENDKNYYHILIEGSGKLVRGRKTIKDNVSSADGVYAAHTRGANTGSIGVSLCGMAGAVENPFYAGTAPINESQWMTAARVVADCCVEYDIAVGPMTVLSHGEVQKNLGIPQAGKWDVNKVPWAPTLTASQTNDLFRSEVRRYTTALRFE